MHGVSTRKVDDLVEALGAASGISKSEVSRICAELDKEMEAFRTRRLDHVAFPYLFCDATYVKGRAPRPRRQPGGGRRHRRHRRRATARCSAVDVGDSEDGTFWTAFLRGLRERGLSGVRLVISDQHLGLKEAIGKVFIGAGWQRCRVHFLRNALSGVPKAKTQMVAAAIRTIFAQPDAAHVAQQLDVVADTLSFTLPEVAQLLLEAKEDLIAFSSFPIAHWPKLWSTNPLGARERRDQAPHQRRRHLPERRLGAPARDRGARRTARRVGGRRAPLPLRGVDGAHRPGRRGARGEGGVAHDHRLKD